MSRKPENTFIASVHKHLAHEQPYHMKNNNDYTSGIADVWYSGVDADIWVEYKYVATLPKKPRKPFKLGLTALQSEWLKKRYYENRRVMVILGTKEGGYFFSDLDWDKSFTREQMDKWKLYTRKQIAQDIAITTCGWYEAPPKKTKLERCA